MLRDFNLTWVCQRTFSQERDVSTRTCVTASELWVYTERDRLGDPLEWERMWSVLKGDQNLLWLKNIMINSDGCSSSIWKGSHGQILENSVDQAEGSEIFPIDFIWKILSKAVITIFFISKRWLWCSRMNVWNTHWWMNKWQTLIQWTKNARRKLDPTRITERGEDELRSWW